MKIFFVKYCYFLATIVDNNGFPIGSFKTKANRQRTEVIAPFSRRSWGGTRDKPKTSAWEATYSAP